MIWITAIFVIISALLLFSAWGRAYRLKSLASTPLSQKEWSSFRLLILVGLIAYLVALITIFSAGAVGRANILSIVLLVSNLCTFSAITYFRSVCGVAPGFGGEFPQVSKPAGEESRVTGLEESLSKLAKEIRKSAASVVTSAESMIGVGKIEDSEVAKKMAKSVNDANKKLEELTAKLESMIHGPKGE